MNQLEELKQNRNVINSNIKKGFNDNDIEKSDILFSFGNDNKICSKTGAEVKKQIEDIILPKLQLELNKEKIKADSLLSECDKVPTENVENYWLNGLKIEIPYKIFTWQAIDSYCADNANKIVGNIPPIKTVEQENKYLQYNGVVRAICEILVDIETANTIKNNLKDNQKLDLTPRQILSLMF